MICISVIFSFFFSLVLFYALLVYLLSSQSKRCGSSLGSVGEDYTNNNEATSRACNGAN